MRHLEGSRLFPYIAWGTIIMLGVLTYYLAIELQKSAAFLGEKTQENIRALDGILPK